MNQPVMEGTTGFVVFAQLKWVGRFIFVIRAWHILGDRHIPEQLP